MTPLRDAGVRRARLFGSAARGELTETSDLDFLVQMPGVAPFDEFMQMVDAQHRIEQLTRRSVDMVTQLRPIIYAEAEPDMVELPL